MAYWNYRNRGRPSIAHFAPAAISAMLQASRAKYKKKSYTKTKKRPRNNQQYLTGHHDAQSLYKKSSKPRYLRRRWKSFKRKVQWVQANGTPRMTLVHTDLQLPTCNDNEQALAYLPMYSGYGAADPENDMARITDVAQQTTSANLQKGSAYLRLHSALLEATIQNASENTIYMDVYSYYCRKNTEDLPQSTMYTNGIAWANVAGDGDENEPSAIGTEPTINTLGVTPFQSTQFCRYFTITRKTRYQIQAGDSVQLKWSDPRNKTIKMDALEKEGSVTFLKGYSKGWLCQFYTVGANGTPAVKSQAIASGDIIVTRYVNYFFSNVDFGAVRTTAVY